MMKMKPEDFKMVRDAITPNTYLNDANIGVALLKICGPYMVD